MSLKKYKDAIFYYEIANNSTKNLPKNHEFTINCKKSLNDAKKKIENNN